MSRLHRLTLPPCDGAPRFQGARAASRRLAIIVFVCLVQLIASAPTTAQNTVDGEIMKDIAFGRLIGGDGETKLSDFRGRVVLATWYLDAYSGMESARHAVNLAEKYKKKGLAVVLMTTAGATESSGPKERAFLNETFKGHEALLASNPHVPIQFTGDAPYFFVVDAEGRLALSGDYKSKSSAMERAVKKAVAQRAKGWGETDIETKVRKLAYVKDEIAEAVKLVASRDEPVAKSLRDEVQAFFERRLEMHRQLLLGGHHTRAKNNLDKLGESVSGVEAMRERIEELQLHFETDDFKKALDLSEDLDELEARLRRGKSSPSYVRKLEAIAEADVYQPVADRARETAATAKIML